jgi:hypothetical protein
VRVYTRSTLNEKPRTETIGKFVAFISSEGDEGRGSPSKKAEELPDHYCKGSDAALKSLRGQPNDCKSRASTRRKRGALAERPYGVRHGW